MDRDILQQNPSYAVMARKKDKPVYYFKIVKYDGKRAFSEDEAFKIRDILNLRNYETVIVEHHSPFDIINLDDLIMMEFAKKQAGSDEWEKL